MAFAILHRQLNALATMAAYGPAKCGGWRQEMQQHRGGLITKEARPLEVMVSLTLTS